MRFHRISKDKKKIRRWEKKKRRQKAMLKINKFVWAMTNSLYRNAQKMWK